MNLQAHHGERMEQTRCLHRTRHEGGSMLMIPHRPGIPCLPDGVPWSKTVTTISIIRPPSLGVLNLVLGWDMTMPWLPV